MPPKHDTIFGRIIRREAEAKIVYETEDVIAFRDIAPKAPVHVLVCPKEPVPNIMEVTDPLLIGKVMMACAEVVRIEGIEDRGCRIILNTGIEAGQTVYHLHAHVMGGRRFEWPPG
jgi:histidine triad (HIT) family protein